MLANLFMHYAFDTWMAREYPAAGSSAMWMMRSCTASAERQARRCWRHSVGQRMEEVGLRLHPAKTRIVYCKDGKRRGDSEHTSFTFLGFTFQPRTARRNDGSLHLLFLPAISKDALKKISGEVRRWRLHRRVTFTFAGLAAVINPIVAGWMQYYGHFRRSALSPLLARINAYLVRWIRKKYKRLQGTHKDDMHRWAS